MQWRNLPGHTVASIEHWSQSHVGSRIVHHALTVLHWVVVHYIVLAIVLHWVVHHIVLARVLHWVVHHIVLASVLHGVVQHIVLANVCHERVVKSAPTKREFLN